MKKLMMLAAMVALVLVIFAPAALGQPVEAKINEDVFSQAEKGKATAKAGGTEAKAQPCPEGAEAKSGDITAKAPCPPKAPPPPPAAAAPTAPKVAPAPVPAPEAVPAPAAAAPPPKAAPPAPPKALPPTGGMGIASLLGLGGGALLVGGGLLARRFFIR